MSISSEHRSAKTVTTDVEAVIQFKQGQDETRKEITKLSSLSKSGCSFELDHPCQVGRLVTMVTALPAEYRAYDLNEEVYPVIGLVQHCYETNTSDQSRYRIGVAFIGKSFPDSYKKNPLQNYHICGTTPSGLWRITESSRTFQVRNVPRFWITIDVTITWVQKEKRANHKQDTVTVNISSAGASVLCSLTVKVGDRLKFASKVHDFYTIGVVRNRRERPDKLPIVHLEFIDRRFPIEKLSVPQVTAVTDRETDDLPVVGAGYLNQKSSYANL